MRRHGMHRLSTPPPLSFPPGPSLWQRCSKVTDVGLGLVANFCKHLASLELYRLVGITDAGVELLRRMRPELQLSMYKCSLVSMRDL